MSNDADKKKYDRQLRIWGAHGQRKLETARVCLLHAGATGSEALKNLVLGGIAAFTVVDDAKVEASDLGNNFLVDADSLGKNRAAAVTGLLKELNPSVAGSFVEDTAESLLESRPDFFKDFELVIAAQAHEQLAIKLDEVCREYGSRLLLARTVGLVGYVRPSFSEHQVIESKPDYPEEDLRLHRPWLEVKQWAEGIELASLDDAGRAHVPFVAILIQACRAWREQKSPKLPSTSKEKAAFKEFVRSWQRQIDGVPIEEDNFSEALESRRLFRLFTPPASIPAEIAAIIEDPKAKNPDPATDDFWILAAALGRFVAEEGAGDLPLEGSIPDMTATTALYLDLQRIFREQAERDCAALEGHVRQIEAAIGRKEPQVPSSSVKFFAKNARNLRPSKPVSGSYRVVRYPSLAAETGGKAGDALRGALEKEDLRVNAALYLLLRAADRFRATHSHFPGSFQSGLEEDVALLKGVAAGLAAEASVNGSAIPDDYIAEIVRFGSSEPHSVAAIIGGIAAQEAIKILTGQFVPLGGTLIYNGMAGTSTVFDF